MIILIKFTWYTKSFDIVSPTFVEIIGSVLKLSSGLDDGPATFHAVNVYISSTIDFNFVDSREL
jgi:hypothetical protein